MTSADFLAHRNRIYSKTSPGKSIFLHPIPDTSTQRKSPFRCISVRLLTLDVVLLWILILSFVPPMYFLFVGTGLCRLASFTAWVTPNQLATCYASGRYSVRRDLHPLEINLQHALLFSNKICNFKLFIELY
jgi:hypothetical protein